MRRNLRLDWRALALLGALLSIIVEWPGLLVYAMPTIFLSAASQAQAPLAAHSLPSAMVLLQQTATSTPPTSQVTREAAVNLTQEAFQNRNQSENNPINNELNNSSNSNKIFSDSKQKDINVDDELLLNVNSNRSSRGQSKSVPQAGRAESRGRAVAYASVPLDSSTENSIRVKQEANDETDTEAGATEQSASTTAATLQFDEQLKSTVEPELRLNDNEPATSSTTSPNMVESTTAVADYEDSSVASSTPVAADSSSTRPLFAFSSSHHMAVLLSRTERSIQTPANTGHSRKRGGHRKAGNMVRRSSDNAAGSKMKRLNAQRHSNGSRYNSNLDRNERSTISHLSGQSRKIRILIQNRFIQLLPDGTVNGTLDEKSDYTILQRSTVDVGRLKIQGVATCLYLCMDACGSVYGSKEFTDDCVFNENMEHHNFNTYSSTYNSNVRRVYYLAMKRNGKPRKLQIPSTRPLGKLATYTNAFTDAVDEERVEQLIAKNFGANRVKHGLRQLCDTGKPLVELIDGANFKARPKCNPNSSSAGANSSASSSSSSSFSNSKKPSNILARSHSSSGASHSAGQLLNNVPAANDNTRIHSSSAVTNSNSHSHSSSESEISATSGSVSNSQATKHIGHTSSSQSSNSNNNSDSSNHSHHIESASQQRKHQQHNNNGFARKKKKRRKCLPHEDEAEHNCERSKKCRRLMKAHEEEQKKLLAKGEPVTQWIVPRACMPKNGPGGNGGGGPKKNGGGADGNKKGRNQNPNNNNSSTSNSLGPVNRRGKKLNNNNGRQQGGNAGAGNRNGGGPNRKRAKIGGGAQKMNKKHGLKTSTSASTTTIATTTKTTTARPSYAAIFGLASTTTVTPLIIHPTTALSGDSDESIDPQAGPEATSARGERDREQRNVRYTNSMEGEEDADGGSQENSTEEMDSSAGVEEDAATSNEDDADDAYYDDEIGPSAGSSQGPAGGSHAHNGGDVQTQLIGGAEDFLYYDQLDFLPIGLWELFALLWITIWCLHIRI